MLEMSASEIRTIIAMVFSLLSLLLLIIRFLLFLNTKLLQPSKQEVGGTSETPVSQGTPVFQGKHPGAEKIMQALLNGDREQFFRLVLKETKKDPGLGFSLRQEIAWLLRQGEPDQAFGKSYRQLLKNVCPESQSSEQALFNSYCLLIESACELSLTPFSRENALAWENLGQAYQNLAVYLAPRRATDYQEAAQHCSTHALYAYRVLNTARYQINTAQDQLKVLLRLGDMLANNLSATSDQIAGWQTICDYYEQAQELLKGGSTPDMRILSAIYFGLFDAKYALYRQLHDHRYWQEASDVYNELKQFYQRYGIPSQTMQEKLQEVANRLGNPAP